MNWRTLFLAFAGLLFTLFIAIQFVPVERTNPPISQSVVWDSPETERLARAACYDCHSNETVWPWYNNIAPISWRVTQHVNEGRQKLNFSEWDKPQEDADETIEVIQEGEMPLRDYLLMHPEADLSTAEQQTLINGIQITFRQDPPQGGQQGERSGDNDDEGDDD
jgi:hypothetical protein